MSPRNYEQKTCEGCLSANLLRLTNRKLTKEKELDILNYALEFSKKNFTIGHLDYIAKHTKKSLEFFIENETVFKVINNLDFSNKIKLFRRKTTLNLINKLINRSPVILYVDSFYLWKIKHYPHFITIVDGKYKIFDPWDGKTKFVGKETISKSIRKLRNLLKICPQAIQIR